MTEDSTPADHAPETPTDDLWEELQERTESPVSPGRARTPEPRAPREPTRRRRRFIGARLGAAAALSLLALALALARVALPALVGEEQGGRARPGPAARSKQTAPSPGGTPRLGSAASLRARPERDRRASRRRAGLDARKGARHRGPPVSRPRRERVPRPQAPLASGATEPQEPSPPPPSPAPEEALGTERPSAPSTRSGGQGGVADGSRSPEFGL
jgi:hypothetical protein